MSIFICKPERYNGQQALTQTGLQIRTGSAVTVGGLYFSYVTHSPLTFFTVVLCIFYNRTFFGGSDSSWATPVETYTVFRQFWMWGGSGSGSSGSSTNTTSIGTSAGTSAGTPSVSGGASSSSAVTISHSESSGSASFTSAASSTSSTSWAMTIMNTQTGE